MRPADHSLIALAVTIAAILLPGIATTAIRVAIDRYCLTIQARIRRVIPISESMRRTDSPLFLHQETSAGCEANPAAPSVRPVVTIRAVKPNAFHAETSSERRIRRWIPLPTRRDWSA